MTAAAPSHGRTIPATSPMPDAGNASPPTDPLLIPPPTSHFAPSRDPSITRGRASSGSSGRNASPRSILPPGAGWQHVGSGDIDRRPSLSYGHHRQTSIVNGVHHARHPSQLSSSTSSPLSPQMLASAGIAADGSIPNLPFSSLQKSPSLSNLSGTTFNSAVVTPNRSFDASRSQRAPERMHSTRLRRVHEPQRSQTRTPQLGSPQELRTVGEYALHHLFTSFMAAADERIERCIGRSGERERRVETICGLGVDPAFDQLLSSLGHINRHKPQPLIHSVITWHNEKREHAKRLAAELHGVGDAASITQRPARSEWNTPPAIPPTASTAPPNEHEVILAERRSTISVYILCRVMIEAFGHTSLKALEGTDVSYNTNRMEEIIYNGVHNAEPDAIASDPLLRANWVIRGQLLGVMSGVRFEHVIARFIRDLEDVQKKLSVKGITDTKLASKTAMLVQSMRWIKIRTQPEEVWEQSCEKLLVLARFFAEVRGRTMKHAYAELFESLLLPVAATATTELSLRKWKDVVDTIKPKISQMLSKTDHWLYVFPLETVLLCVSPADKFAMQWLPLAMSCKPQSRDRAGRSHALKAICRLVWRYLYRYNESPNAVTRKLEEIVKLVFQGGRRVLISTDPIIADPLIQLIRVIGFRQQELCFRTIIFPLMNADLFSTPEKAQEVKFESLDPEKTVIAIRAFLAIMTDLEKGEAPSFPASFECDALMDPSSRSPITHRRTKSQGFALSAGRTERLSHPVVASQLGDVAKDYYLHFCQILQHITRICDEGIGGKASLSEKFSAQTPKTPMAEAFMFNRRDDVANVNDLRQNYYDLLHVAVEALPRCLSPGLPIPNSQVNLLCTGTAHLQSHIANSSVQALKSIARQSHAQQITIGFARFIFNFDDQYATVSDSSLLGPGHIESTLELYVELLQIWIDEIEQRTRIAVSDPSDDDEQSVMNLPLDLSAVLAHVDEVESHGLFFLCSPSRTVRAIAVSVLRLVTKFDTALGKPSARIISILEGSSDKVIDINDERLSIAERSLLQKGLSKTNANSTLVELCSSEVAHDANLWFKIFPNLVRLSQEVCLHAVALTRELVLQRLGHSQQWIEQLADPSKQLSTTTHEPGFSAGRPGARYNSSSPEIIIEQWKIHLIFACTTLTNIGASNVQNLKSSQTVQHTRKGSKNSASKPDKVTSANELFKNVAQFLDAPNPAVRKAAVIGLGATNATLFQTLLDCLQDCVQRCTNEAKLHLSSHQRSVSGPRRTRQADYLRTEITHLFSLTAHLLDDPSIPDADSALPYMIDYAKQLRLFLSDTEIQHELQFQKLRMHFCTLMETMYEKVRKQNHPAHPFSFRERKATYILMENWCGFSPDENHLRRREDHLRRSMLDREQGERRVVVNSAFEKERNELQNAALSAMAALCAGPLRFVASMHLLDEFDLRRMWTWIGLMFEAPSDRTHAFGRKALQNLIMHNLDNPQLMAHAIRMCYVARMPKALASYFEVVVRVLAENTNITTPFWKILCAGLYTLGNEDRYIRLKSVRLLRTLEERQGRTSKLQDLDISVSDKTTAVYKLAQFEISRRLAKQHHELAFYVFSEFSAYFNELEPDHQRNMVSGMLPWIQAIELQLDPNGGPTLTSYMLLVNMFEITVRSSIALHNEIQALWQALATGPYGGNVQLALDFIITICLEKREQNFVVYAKQIVVFLSKTPAGARVVEYLMLQITPKNMVPEPRVSIGHPGDKGGLPYVADLDLVLPRGTRQGGLSLAQLSMMLLVDLIVSPFSLPADKIPILLQIVLVQWDQYMTIVQDQAREMLVHLIHELVISKIEPGSTKPDKKSIEDFIESVHRNDPKTAWSYTDDEITPQPNNTRVVPAPMAYIVDEVVNIFSVTHPGLRDAWGKVAMSWATSCAVRHVACRSFQVFRCISIAIDQQMLSDMLARLSNTIADDENNDYVVFSMEILTTLRCVIDCLTPLDLLSYTQLFWTTCACLETIFEREFDEGIAMLDLLLNKMDLSDPAVLKILHESQPSRWEGEFRGLHVLVYPGMRSSNSMVRTLAIMERLLKLPSSSIVGMDERLLFTVLANLPRFLRNYHQEGRDPQCLVSAEVLALAAESQNHVGLVRVLQSFAKGNYKSEKDFLAQCISALKVFFPLQEFSSLVFLLGMVNNSCSWFKVKTMQVLCALMPEIDMRNSEIVSQGPDLISPLLRLLQTEHSQQALAVLDNAIDMTGTPLDGKHLRMSMAGSHSSRATRKEYDTTKSLYGIPEESGWSVPTPALLSKQTQNNVHAVFSTLESDSNGHESMASTPEIEFHSDDYTYFHDRTATMVSDDTKIDGNMGDLAMKLDSLDDFFDEEPDETSPLDNSGVMQFSNGLVEDRENLYDQQALPILHRSLQRNVSISSFQTGFVDSRYAHTREPAVMNPAAFAVPPPTAPVRPSLRTRSITSPAAPTKRSLASNADQIPPHDLTSGDEGGDEPEPFSDDDANILRARMADSSNVFTSSTALQNAQQHTAKPSGFANQFRQGLRRLTSSGGNREAQRAAAAAAAAAMRDESPRLPKLPATYLKDSSSTDT